MSFSAPAAARRNHVLSFALFFLVAVCLGLTSCDVAPVGGGGGDGDDTTSTDTGGDEVVTGGDGADFVAPSGATYYVATGGSDDTGDGSEGSPWASITHAITQVEDGSTILVKPGTYNGRQDLQGRFEDGVAIRSEVPYEAQLRNDGRALTCFFCEGVAIEGFDIAHSGPGASGLVVQIQDLLGSTNGPDDGEVVSDIVLRNNVFHDSYNNDILKVGNGATGITIEGNVFYNQTGVDEHVDLNSVADVLVQDNIFFNDFAGSGRTNDQSTTSYLIIKDSNAGNDDYVGNQAHTVRRNIFLNYEGRNDGIFVKLGPGEISRPRTRNMLIENNLMLGNGEDVLRSPFGFIGADDIAVRFNTVVGDLPTRAYGLYTGADPLDPPNDNLSFYGNIWSDPTGTMASQSLGYTPYRFTASNPGSVATFILDSNLYWNGGEDIPESEDEEINYTDDDNRVVADPQLPAQDDVQVPRWEPSAGQFADGSSTIREAFEALAIGYGMPASGSAAIGAGTQIEAGDVPAEDLLGNSRGASSPTLGAVSP